MSDFRPSQELAHRVLAAARAEAVELHPDHTVVGLIACDGGDDDLLGAVEAVAALLEPDADFEALLTARAIAGQTADELCDLHFGYTRAQMRAALAIGYQLGRLEQRGRRLQLGRRPKTVNSPEGAA